MTSSASLPSASAEPERVGRYLLYDAIGRGGMAQVHLALMTGPVGFSRIVAVKRLHPHLALESELVSMFLDEARLAARVRHPNVVPILDVVSLPTELLLVLEYVVGQSLSSLMSSETKAGQRIPPAIASSILVGVLTGLHAAHEAKSEGGAPLHIVHRDVSPQNVMVGADGLARVLDFGIAHAADRLAMTRAGEVKGKPPYMSPEQIRGREVDRRTDVYSAGVLAWEIFTGLRLFQGVNDAHVYQLVSAGAKRSVRDLVPELPEELSSVVMKAIALDPARRFQTARDFAVALEKALPPASQRTVAEWVERAAGPAVAARAELVARIEAGERAVPVGRTSAAPPGAATAISTEHSELGQSTSFTASDLTSMQASRIRSTKAPDRLWLALGGSVLGALVFCAVVLVVLAARGRGGNDPGTASSAIESTATEPETRATATVPAPTVAPAAPDSSVETEPDAGATSPAPTATRAPSAKPGSKPPTSRSANPCDPPFAYVGRVKVPKPECF